MSDYLWNKEGHDPEVEALEKTLSVFTEPSSLPPRIPKESAARQPRFWNIFRLAVAAPVLAAVVSAMVWFGIEPPNEGRETSAGKPASEFGSKVEALAAAAKNDAPVDAVQNAKINAPVRRVVRNRSPLKVNRRKRSKRLNHRMLATKPNSPAKVHLTKEEEYAYSQLMKALAITSSKLRLVRDKVDGVKSVEEVRN
jgi:hypothetical protein